MSRASEASRSAMFKVDPANETVTAIIETVGSVGHPAACSSLAGGAKSESN
jgi:hypothetical protein